MAAQNYLQGETSPYLLQHKDNPVGWYPWGEEAFQAAREQDKPIFLSIGYSTCYWCHVMEKESFENEEVAELLNRHFISIKVDREERPDVDQIYMDCVVSLTGRGGWPLSVMLTPKLEPFWGGTYFPRENFMHILNQIAAAWTSQRLEVSVSASKITDILRQQAGRGVAGQGELTDPFQSVEKAAAAYLDHFDTRYGGFGSAPKFPPSQQISLLLREFLRTKKEGALLAATHTLHKMAAGGIYDHLGGGFARYSTDEKWLVPHFEKMLYDNALLTVSYLEAYQLTSDATFARVARETLEYVIRDMSSPDGGMYAAEDAGEVGKEGEFYVWRYSELEELLTSDELVAFEAVYSVTPEGNFEHGTNVLALHEGIAWEKKDSPELVSAHAKLREIRSARKRPHLDDKILTGWNGLMISALCKGFQVLGEPRFREQALFAASFLKRELFVSGERALLRSYCRGEARHRGCLEDYAFFIQGLIDLYESTFDLDWLDFARELQTIQDEAFWDQALSAYQTSRSEELIVRKPDFFDGAVPSGNSVALLNLERLFRFYGDTALRERADQLLRAFVPFFEKYPSGLPKALQGVSFRYGSTFEIVVASPDATDPLRKDLLEHLYRAFVPNKIVATITDKTASRTELPLLLRGREAKDGRSAVYLCREGACELPVYNSQEAMAKLTTETGCAKRC